MKIKKLTAAVLAVALLLVPARAEGEVTHTSALTESVSYTDTVFESTQRQEEHYITYMPGGNAYPTIFFGDHLNQRITQTEANEAMKAEGKRIIAAVNGDYFVIASGEPVGIVIKDGELVSSDDGNAAIGFSEDGTLVFGKPELRLGIDIEGNRYRLGGINRSLRDNEFCIYTAAYGTQTPAADAQYLILKPKNEGEVLRVGTETSLIVDANFHSEKAVAIAKNAVVLCLTDSSDEWRKAAVSSLHVGDSVSISAQSENPLWSACKTATGSLYKLISAGKVEEGLNQIDSGMSPRTAIGQKADGTVIFYTVDGRQNDYSRGLTMQELAERLLALGCVEAGALDGGGSTTLWAQRPGEESCDLLNQPSLGVERAVSTMLLIVTDGESSGTLKTLSVYADSVVAMAGAKLGFTCGGCDEAGAAVKLEGLKWSADKGKIDGNGEYTAPEYACMDEITAKVGAVTESYYLTVVKNPDSIAVLQEGGTKALKRLVLNCGEETELTARARWRLCDALSQDENFVWSCEGNAGVIDENGTFKAGKNGGSGVIRVSVGDVSTDIEVSVKADVICAADFETLSSGSAVGLTWTQETSRDLVRNGKACLRLDYDLESGSAEYPLNLPLAEYSDYMHFWLRGDGSDNGIYLKQGGEWREIESLRYGDWKLVTVKTGYSDGVSGLMLRGSGKGSLWLDQIVLNHNALPDMEPPVLQLRADGPHITGSALDWVDGTPDAENIVLTVDGTEIPFRYNGVTGELDAMAEDNGRMSRATLTVSDKSGNLISASVTIEGETKTPFPDLNGHWAEQYAGYLYGRGIINGKLTQVGTVFDPEAPVTRAEFAVMLIRWLGIETDGKAELDFQDADAVPDWAGSSVAKAVELGLIKGSATTVGLYLFPNQPLTRAEATTILGRTLEAGRLSADLSFPDIADIPQWALQYVGTLNFMGSISGYDDGCFYPANPLTRAQAAKMITMMS